MPQNTELNLNPPLHSQIPKHHPREKRHMPKTTVPMHIFRAYDIRGIYQKDLTPKIAETIGKAFGTYLGTNKNLAVARDIRIGGQQLKNAMTSGLASKGNNTVDEGIT